MINKDGQYWHLYYNVLLADPSDAKILAYVRELFGEISQMGDEVFMRAPPRIERQTDFEGIVKVNIFCRLSSKAAVEKPLPALLGFS